MLHISQEGETIITIFLLTKRIVNGYPGAKKKIYKYPTCNEALSLLSSFTNEILSTCTVRVTSQLPHQERDKASHEFFFTCLVLSLESDDRLL